MFKSKDNESDAERTAREAQKTQAQQRTQAGDAKAATDKPAELPDGTPEHVKAAAEKLGGDVPRAAPKGHEGPPAKLAPNEDDPNRAVPELEPALPPTEYRAAPYATTPKERDAWDAGARPSREDLETATTVEIRTTDPRSAGIYIAGIMVKPEPQKLAVETVRARGISHLAQLATDPRIEVRGIEKA